MDMDRTTTPANQPSQPEMVFTMGIPAAGKSTVAAAKFGATHTIIDPDAIKETHPSYDPENPTLLHAWSQEVTEQMFHAAIESGAGAWVIDGTGTNAEKMVRRINQARAAGFTVRVVFITCSLQTSLRRNAARIRKVPVECIISKARDIQTAFEIVRTFADTTEIVDTEN
jgi:predicted ABC-type ATPase